MPSLTHAMTTTANALDGYRTTKSLGIVRGITVRSRSVIGSIGAGLQTLVGGNITILTELCETARNAAIGHLAGAAAKQTIDASGKIVAPGFIDMLGQSELTVLVDPTLPSKIFQGITTEITGEGNSVAPLNDEILKADRLGYEHFKIV